MNQMLFNQLAKHTSTLNDELICKEEITPNHKIRIGSKARSLKVWMYIAYFGETPKGRIYSYSKTPNSIDPKYFYTSQDVENSLPIEA